MRFFLLPARRGSWPDRPHMAGAAAPREPTSRSAARGKLPRLLVIAVLLWAQKVVHSRSRRPCARASMACFGPAPAALEACSAAWAGRRTCSSRAQSVRCICTRSALTMLCLTRACTTAAGRCWPCWRADTGRVMQWVCDALDGGSFSAGCACCRSPGRCTRRCHAAHGVRVAACAPGLGHAQSDLIVLRTLHGVRRVAAAAQPGLAVAPPSSDGCSVWTTEMPCARWWRTSGRR
jgi:hypothetical protein